MGRLSTFFIVNLLIFGSVEAASNNAYKLGKSNIRPSMEEMLNYHVEFKEFSPLLVKRSFKLFLEQFDPYKVYVLQKEATPFLNMNEKDAFAVVEAYYKDDYPKYEALNELIRRSIFRARDLREKIAKDLIENFEGNQSPSVDLNVSYAKDAQDLSSRIKSQMQYILMIEKKQEQLETWTAEDKEKILTLWEKRFRRMEETYLANDTQHNLALHILKSMAKSLDAHTSFFSPEEAFELRTSLEKQFEGVGVVLREGINGVVVKNLIKGGPAERSGKIQVGDILVEVNGTKVESVSYDEILELLKGQRGEKVTLGVKQPGTDVKRVDLVRDKIVMQEERLQYSYEPCAEGIIGKFVLPSFYESGDGSSCEKDLREALKDLKKKGNIHGLIVDMRENSGGFLNQAVKLAGLFISSGVIVISKYSKGEMQYLRDIDGRVFYEGPLILLTSKASASAAEIVAQALQDYGLALIVGDERTYGKGSIQYQTVTDDDASTYFKVTVGKYYTVSGRSTQIEGVKADVHVPTEYAPYNIGEKYLMYPLKNDQVAPAYLDPLLDVDQRSRAWLQKNYLPNLQKKLSVWTQMLPVLKANSQYRIEHDKNFLLFLKLIRNEQPEPEPVEPSVIIQQLNFGQEDLQMTEAVNIIKDMILLQSYQGSPQILRK